MFLDKIVAVKKREIQRLQNKAHSLEKNHDQWGRLKARSLSEIVKRTREIAIIAEIKPASPSRGVISENVNPVEKALSYEKGGAAAISVLTEEQYFKGKAESLTLVRKQIRLPVLRKDFIIDPLQVYESKQMGADVILLIAAILNQNQLVSLTKLAHQLGMEVLVEVHAPSEIEAAVLADPDLIGINNRNLKTLSTDLSITEQLRPMIPPPFLVIGESGIHSVEDVKRMAETGVDGLLIGEYLMRQEDPQRAIEVLRNFGSSDGDD